MVSKAFPDFGLLRGPSNPQAAKDGWVRAAAIEAVRIPRTTRRPRVLACSARAETMVRSVIISSSCRSKTDPGDGREAHSKHEPVQHRHPVLTQSFVNTCAHPLLLPLVALLSLSGSPAVGPGSWSIRNP